MQKQITLTIEQAREMLGKDSAMDQLIRANFTEDELNLQPKYPKRWDGLSRVDGFYVDNRSGLCFISDFTSDIHKNTFATEPQARSFGLIYPQLTQLMKAYRCGWVPDWNNINQTKYTVFMESTTLHTGVDYLIRRPICLPTHEIAEQFLTDHRDLITEFFKGM